MREGAFCVFPPGGREKTEDGVVEFERNPHLAKVHSLNGLVCELLLLNGSAFRNSSVVCL